MIICRRWYRFYAPAKFVHRRNIGQVKVADSLILALLIWQAKTELNLKEDSVNALIAYHIRVLTAGPVNYCS